MPPTPASLHLITQYCSDPRPQRAAEYDECLRRNLANCHVSRLHNLVEPATTVPDEFRTHPKYHEHPLPRWMTFLDAFNYAATHLPGQTACILNLDIFLDPASDWLKAADFAANNIVLCLSRTEFRADGTTYKDPALEALSFAQSQDAWLFQASFIPPDCDFEIGTLGCDNALAERIRRTGKIPINAPARFQIFHYDQFRGKNPHNQAQILHAERANKPSRPDPAASGQLLLPDIDAAKSVDAILNFIQATDITRYQVICDVLSKFVSVRNEKP